MTWIVVPDEPLLASRAECELGARAFLPGAACCARNCVPARLSCDRHFPGLLADPSFARGMGEAGEASGRVSGATQPSTGKTVVPEGFMDLYTPVTGRADLLLT